MVNPLFAYLMNLNIKNLKNIVLVAFIMLSILRGYAQNETLISKNFKFKDGVYYQFEHLQRNQPNVLWDSLDARLATNPQSLQMYIEVLKHKRTHDSINLNNVWGVVIDGIPYARLPNESQKKSATVFSGMVLRGKLCYFQYDETEERQVPITAYIPQTGQAYMTKNIVQKKDVVREKLVKFETGEVVDFTLFNFKQLIKEDADLLSTVNALKPKEVKEKLFKCLLIFNDRNPVFVK
jgi:hypothetical protein